MTEVCITLPDEVEVESVPSNPLPLFLKVSFKHRPSDALLRAVKNQLDMLTRELEQSRGIRLPVIVMHNDVEIDVVINPNEVER